MKITIPLASNTESNLVDLVNFVRSELKKEKARSHMQRENVLAANQAYDHRGHIITL